MEGTSAQPQVKLTLLRISFWIPQRETKRRRWQVVLVFPILAKDNDHYVLLCTFSHLTRTQLTAHTKVPPPYSIPVSWHAQTVIYCNDIYDTMMNCPWTIRCFTEYSYWGYQSHWILRPYDKAPRTWWVPTLGRLQALGINHKSYSQKLGLPGCPAGHTE